MWKENFYNVLGESSRRRSWGREQRIEGERPEVGGTEGTEGGEGGRRRAGGRWRAGKHLRDTGLVGCRRSV